MPEKAKNIPYHLGIIIDGNRRWATLKRLPALEGHRRGLEKVKKCIDWSRIRNVKVLTFFVFSTENWKRSKSEVHYLMKLLQHGFNDLKKNISKINQEGIRIKVIGQKEKLSKAISQSIAELEKLTENNKEMTVNFALSYGGRAEVVEAFKSIIKKKIPPEKITEDIVSQNLWTSDLDLLVRTGKEQRISNFLIWQAAYSELYFCSKHWPDFTEVDLDSALAEYNRRQRRFGK